MERLTLEAGKWYSAEFISQMFGEDIRSYSPIKIYHISTEQNGSRTIHIDFYHANYPEGVRDKRYTVRTIERNAVFMLAEQLSAKPKRFLFISEISLDWVCKHFGYTIDKGEDIQQWLDRNV